MILSQIDFFPIPDGFVPEIVAAAAKCAGHWVLMNSENDAAFPEGMRGRDESVEETGTRILDSAMQASAASFVPVKAFRRDGIPGILLYAEIAALPEQLPDGVSVFERVPKAFADDFNAEAFIWAQDYLNTITSPDEMWDLLDENGEKTGKLHRRGDPLKPGERHLVVYIWIRRSDGRFLLTRRAPNKGYPNMWECTGGSAIAGDDSLSAALREVREETGIVLLPEEGRLFRTHKFPDAFAHVWFFNHEFDSADVVCQPGETTAARAATIEEIEALNDSGEFVPYEFYEDFIRAVEGGKY